MESMQKRFWPDDQPLVERLGREFFRELPERPGVYLMQGAGEAVLYVGKAKSLRHRLGSYRVANPDRMARRTLRLLRLVAKIAWEECVDEAAALRRESELLLSLKPRFNRAGVWQGPERFLGWRVEADSFELGVWDKPEAGWNCVGPFRGKAVPLYRALVRLFWLRCHPDLGLAGMPSGWFAGLHGSQVKLRPAEGLLSQCHDALVRLTRDGVVELETWIPEVRRPFEQVMWDEDMEFVSKHLAGK